MLTLDHASVVADDVDLIRDVSIAVSAGKVVALVGANGAGKTTVLRALSGDVELASGRVCLDETHLSDLAPVELAKRRAVLSQKSLLAFDFTVLQVVLLGRTPHDTRHTEDLDVACAAMQSMEVETLASRPYSTLSGGEQQRVHMARVLAQLSVGQTTGTRYLLLDEPTSALDLAHQHDLLTTARRCADDGVGVLVVLHDLNLTAQYADEVVVMKQGRVIARGAPWEVLTREIIHEAFDISAVITRHPIKAVPLIVPVPDTSTRAKLRKTQKET